MSAIPLSVAEFNTAENLQIAKRLICQHMDEPDLDDAKVMEIHNLVMKALSNGWGQGVIANQVEVRKAIGIFK